MISKIRPIILAGLLSAILSTLCFAEYASPISPGGGIYDQPSTVADGSTVHVAFIGGPGLSGPFSVYYAAVNGSTDFTLKALSGLLTTPAYPIADAGGDPYYDARHPKIALQTANVVVVFFQAKPTSDPADHYVLYRAQLSLSNHAVIGCSVKTVSFNPGIVGEFQDVSFGIVTKDNTARLAYAYRESADSPFDTYYARIGLDNAAVVRLPIKLSNAVGTTGSRPIPNLKLDGDSRSHIAWTTDNGTIGTYSGVYYAMVKEFSNTQRGISDNAAIAATGVILRIGRWGHPQVLVSPSTNSLVYVLATDEPSPGSAGNLAMVYLNPDKALQDNNSVDLGRNNDFLLHPPGVAILPSSFDLFRAEAHIDLGGRFHLTGYGNSRSTPIYYAGNPLSTYPYFNFQSWPTPVGFQNAATSYELPDDYTKAAFSFVSSKGVVFWSGTDNTNPSNRALMVTGLPTINEWIVNNEKGCSSNNGSRSGKSGTGMIDLLLLAVPLVLLKLRSILKRG